MELDRSLPDICDFNDVREILNNGELLIKNEKLNKIDFQLIFYIQSELKNP